MIDHDKVQYSVVVPVYNSEGSLKLLHERLAKVFSSIGVSWELVLVNDCSKDSSWDICKELADNDQRVVAVNLANNFGQHNAIMCGLSVARGESVITMDDDLQHPPEEVVKLIMTAEDGGFLVVYGQYQSRKYGWFKNLCSVALNRLISRITARGYIATSFRIIKKPVAEKIISFRHHNVVIDVLLKDAISRRNIGHVLVEHHPRQIGRSSYTYAKMFAYALDMIFNYTLWPLRLATLLGLASIIVSILLGVYFLAEYFIFGAPARGFAALAIMITFFFGTSFFILGIIGEYVGRMFFNLNQKPQYFVKEVYKATGD